MSEYDRGAYAPYDDGLSLGGYARPQRGRAPLPMALLGSVVVLLMLCTALVLFYRSGSKSAAGLPRPVGAGGIAVIKTAPSGPQPTEPGAGLEVYSPQNVPSAGVAPPAPRFATPPEQPIARPAPPPAAAVKPAPALAPAIVAPPPAAKVASAGPARSPAKVEGGSPVVVKSAPARAEAPPIAPVTSAPARAKASATVAAAPSTVASDEITTLLGPAKPAPAKLVHATAPTRLAQAAKAAPRAEEADAEEDETAPAAAVLPKGPLAPSKPSPLKSASAKAAPAKPTPAVATAVDKPAPKGGFSVQVGAFASADMAQKGFADAAKRAGAAGGGRSRSVQTVQKDGKTYYRSNVGGFATKAEAVAYCAAVRAKGGPCAVH